MFLKCVRSTVCLIECQLEWRLYGKGVVNREYDKVKAANTKVWFGVLFSLTNHESRMTESHPQNRE